MADERQTETASAAASTAPPDAGRRDQGQPAGSETAARAMTDPISELQHRCLRNAAYYEDREAHFDRLHKFVLFLIVISGSAAFPQVITPLGIDWLTPELALAVASIAGLCDLVFDIAGKARQHATLRWRALDIYAGTHTQTCDVEALEAAIARLYTDEPPTMKVVNLLADNTAARALDGDKREIWIVPFWSRLLRHWCRYSGTDFKQVKEVRA